MTSKIAADKQPTKLSPAAMERLRSCLQQLYGPRADTSLTQLTDIVHKYSFEAHSQTPNRWDERDVVLITYGDQVQNRIGPALPALQEFLTTSNLTQVINTVHILPFFPYSSDDGFSVIDYRNVDPRIGDWNEVRELGNHVGLMFDLVLNHCSAKSQWFQHYLAGQDPFSHYFIEADPNEDLSQVTRPRSLPLLTPFETSRGLRHVWTTFSDDQVDLNFSEPDVLVEFIDILLFFVEQGARIIRLDAIAYLWKEIGTNCIHLSQTHEVVKLMRDVLDAVAPHVLLLTETNVPHEENVSYFGDGDEAHMVYQFSLPPLLLDAFLNEDATPLRKWLTNLQPAPDGTTFFNFTASHDGVGVRPLEGLVSDERLAKLVNAVKQCGGLVNTKKNADGSDSPYELNITYLDALAGPGGMEPALHARRFLSSQAIMLSLPGVPGIYFHSLVGTGNDYDGVKQSGQARRINRYKYQLDELRQHVAQSDSVQSLVFNGYQKLLTTRTEQPAFHPDASCKVVDTGNDSLLAFLRERESPSQGILVIANVSSVEQQYEFPEQEFGAAADDLLGGAVDKNSISVAPFQVLWIKLAP